MFAVDIWIGEWVLEVEVRRFYSIPKTEARFITDTDAGWRCMQGSAIFRGWGIQAMIRPRGRT